MVNTLKKVVLGVLLGATVTVAFGAVNTFACDKADDPAEKWAEAREQMIENYKADLEEKKEEEKAARQAVRDEVQYARTLQNNYEDSMNLAKFYVSAVAEESRGLDSKSIKQAQEYAKELANYANWLYNVSRNSFKSQAQADAFLEFWNSYDFDNMTDEDWAEYDKQLQAYEEFFKDAPVIDYDIEDWAAYVRTYNALHPDKKIVLGDVED